MAPIPIMHLVNNLSDCSISNIALEIIKYAPAKEYMWYVGSLAGDGPMLSSFSKAGATILDYSGRSAPRSLRSDLRNHKIQLLHSHSPKTALSGWKAIAGIPWIIRPKHATTKHLITGKMDRNWGLIYSMVDYMSLYMADQLMPVSKTMQTKILRLPFMTPNKVTAIPNGVPCEKYSDSSSRLKARRELGIPDSSICFGFAGRLDPVKRIDILLNAFQQVYQKYPRSRLLILGEGQLMNDLQLLAGQLEINDAVIWAGFRSDMPDMLAAMDIYLQPSDNEGLSLSILEAMAARRPVVATRVGAAEEVLTHRKTGWLIQPGSISELQDGMLYLIEHPEYGLDMAAAAYDHVLSNYSTQRMTVDYLNVYRGLLSGSNNA